MSPATDPLASITDSVYERLVIRGLPAKRLYSAKIQGGPDLLKGKRCNHIDDAKFSAKQIVDRDYRGMVAVEFEVEK